MNVGQITKALTLIHTQLVHALECLTEKVPLLNIYLLYSVSNNKKTQCSLDLPFCKQETKGRQGSKAS